MVRDLADVHELVSELFKWPTTEEEWDSYRLSEDQVQHFHEFGYVSGIKLLDDKVIHQLRKELDQLVNPKHPGNLLFYEFHSNESSTSDSILFHSLGHWRITEGFHDVL